MIIYGTTLTTPEEVAAWLETQGTGLPPHYEGTGQALRLDGDDEALAMAGALHALTFGRPYAQAQAIRSLQGRGGPVLVAAIAEALEHPPAWWNTPDPTSTSETLGERFLDMACSVVARDPILGPLLMERAIGTHTEDEALWSVLAWRKEGPALERLLTRLNNGETWPPDRWPRVVARYAKSPRLAELIKALQQHHGRDVRDAILATTPEIAQYWP